MYTVEFIVSSVFFFFYPGQCSHHMYARTGEEMELSCASLPWYENTVY